MLNSVRQLVGASAGLRVEEFAELYERSNDSIAHQDRLMAFYEQVGAIGGCWTMTDDEALGSYRWVLEGPFSNRAKVALLDLLSTAVVNHHPRGMGCGLVDTISDAQYVLLKSEEVKNVG